MTACRPNSRFAPSCTSPRLSRWTARPPNRDRPKLKADGCQLSATGEVCIRRVSPQPRVLDRRADGEVIQVLKAVAGQAEQVVKGVVEVAADAGRANPRCFRLQVEDVAEDAGLPAQAAIPPRALLADAVAELRDHAEAQGAARRDPRVTAHRLRPLPQLTLRPT